MKDKLLEIINHYGIDKQLKYIHSEYFELDEAVINAEHNRYIGIIRKPGERAINDIAEEIADVMVMLKQFQYYYEIPSEEIEKIMNEKIDRQLERIKKNDEDTIKWLKEHNENAFKKHNILEIEEPKEVVVIEKEEYECLKEENQRLNNVLNALEESYIEDIEKLESFGIERKVEIAEIISCYKFYLRRLRELKESDK